MSIYTLGIDIGSTTAKVVLMEGDRILYEKYERHFSQVRQKTLELLEELRLYLEPLAQMEQGLYLLGSSESLYASTM